MPRPSSYAVFCLKKKNVLLDGHRDASPGSVFAPAASLFVNFFFRHTAPPEIYTLSLHDALPILKILIFAAEGLTKRSAVGFLLRSLIMFQTFISRHNSNFFSDKLVLTSVTPASSAPVLQTPKATSSTLYFDSLTVNAGNGGFLHCIQMDTSVNAANQVVSVGADIAFDADPKFFACLVRFESSSVPTTLPTAYDVYPLD